MIVNVSFPSFPVLGNAFVNNLLGILPSIGSRVFQALNPEP